MVYSLLYPHNFDDEDALYKALVTLDIDKDRLVIDMSKHRHVENLIIVMAKRLGIPYSEIMTPEIVSDYVLIIYADGEFEVHESKGVQC